MTGTQIDKFLLKAAEDEYVLDVFLDEPRASDAIYGFHAQQAVEKLLKAVLIAAGTRCPRTHRLAELIDLIRDRGVDLPEAFEELRYLTPFAVDFRYDPIPDEPEAPLDRPGTRKLIRDLRSWT